MGRIRTPGLINRGGVWHIDKQIRGIRLRESTGSSDRTEAEFYLAKKIEEFRQAAIYGVRPNRSFREAATKYLNEAEKATLRQDAQQLNLLDPYIGDLPVERVHMGSLQRFIADRKAQGVKHRTINYALQTVRHILNLAAGEWLDLNGLTWLATAPKIKLLPQNDARQPYPLSWDEQTALLNELPSHLVNMVLFKVNTGCREQEVCGLKWEWEVPVLELGTSIFIIPGQCVKNREDRVVILNTVAKSVVDSLRGVHPEYVFTYRGHRVWNINNNAWRKAKVRAGLPGIRVHDLKHTIGRRLRAAGVSFEDRQDLLGHKSGRITTHYSSAELENLLEAANRVCGKGSRNSPALVMLRRA